MSLTTLSLKAALGILTMVVAITGFSIQGISANVYIFTVTVENHSPIPITVHNAEVRAFINNQQVAYGYLSKPVDIVPNTSAIVTGQVTFYQSLDALRSLPQETPVDIHATVKYRIFFFDQSKDIRTIVTLGQIIQQFQG